MTPSLPTGPRRGTGIPKEPRGPDADADVRLSGTFGPSSSVSSAERLASIDHPAVQIRRGDIVLLRGPNGSGKTSILRALAGLPNALGLSATTTHAGFSPQDARDALVGLTVEGEFRLRATLVPSSLLPLRHRASRETSSGEARRIALATARSAPLLLLDEPSEGLDAEAKRALRRVVETHEGAAVIADHAGLLDDLATRVIDLAPTARAPLPPVPRTEGPVVLEAPPARVRGRDLPRVALGPGFHALRGPNGAGKSTLLRRLWDLYPSARLLLPHAGDLLTRERVADECPQHALVPEALRERHPLTLSGGEAQRVALAKVLGVDAPCYLLDEPEAHLDAEGRVLLVEAVAARVKEGACVLAATHDEALAALAQTEVRLG